MLNASLLIILTRQARGPRRSGQRGGPTPALYRDQEPGSEQHRRLETTKREIARDDAPKHAPLSGTR